MNLQRRIEQYLRRSGTPPARFGREVMGDPRFVFDLRRGRTMQPRTERRLAEWLDQRETAAAQ